MALHVGVKSRGGSSPEFGVGDANANCFPRFSKNTAQNSPKHAILSEKFVFFSGERPRLQPGIKKDEG